MWMTSVDSHGAHFCLIESIRTTHRFWFTPLGYQFIANVTSTIVNLVFYTLINPMVQSTQSCLKFKIVLIHMWDMNWLDEANFYPYESTEVIYFYTANQAAAHSGMFQYLQYCVSSFPSTTSTKVEKIKSWNGALMVIVRMGCVLKQTPYFCLSDTALATKHLIFSHYLMEMVGIGCVENRTPIFRH